MGSQRCVIERIEFVRLILTYFCELRVTRNLVSRFLRTTTSTTANGLQMRKKLTSLEILVRYPLHTCYYLFTDGWLDNWDRQSHRMSKSQYGVFEITLPAVNGQPAIPHNSKVKVRLNSSSCFMLFF